VTSARRWERASSFAQFLSHTGPLASHNVHHRQFIGTLSGVVHTQGNSLERSSQLVAGWRQLASARPGGQLPGARPERQLACTRPRMQLASARSRRRLPAPDCGGSSRAPGHRGTAPAVSACARQVSYIMANRSLRAERSAPSPPFRLRPSRGPGAARCIEKRRARVAPDPPGHGPLYLSFMHLRSGSTRGPDPRSGEVAQLGQ
jgi:hypothetical protein